MPETKKKKSTRPTAMQELTRLRYSSRATHEKLEAERVEHTRTKNALATEKLHSDGLSMQIKELIARVETLKAAGAARETTIQNLSAGHAQVVSDLAKIRRTLQDNLDRNWAEDVNLPTRAIAIIAADGLRFRNNLIEELQKKLNNRDAEIVKLKQSNGIFVEAMTKCDPVLMQVQDQIIANQRCDIAFLKSRLHAARQRLRQLRDQIEAALV